MTLTLCIIHLELQVIVGMRLTYLDPVLKLHHAAVEKCGVELRRDAQNFGGGIAAHSRNQISCPKQNLLCVNFPL